MNKKKYSNPVTQQYPVAPMALMTSPYPHAALGLGIGGGVSGDGGANPWP